MRRNRDESIKNIENNIRQIKEQLEYLNDNEIASIYKSLKDVLFFYGFKDTSENFLWKYMIRDVAIEEEANLAELENVTNAILFKIKYQNKQVG